MELSELRYKTVRSKTLKGELCREQISHSISPTTLYCLTSAVHIEQMSCSVCLNPVLCKDCCVQGQMPHYVSLFTMSCVRIAVCRVQLSYSLSLCTLSCVRIALCSVQMSHSVSLFTVSCVKIAVCRGQKPHSLSLCNLSCVRIAVSRGCMSHFFTLHLDLCFYYFDFCLSFYYS